MMIVVVIELLAIIVLLLFGVWLLQRDNYYSEVMVAKQDEIYRQLSNVRVTCDLIETTAKQHFNHVRGKG